MNVTGLTTQQGVDYRQIGVVMRVTPRITPDGKVIMRIEPQISSVSPTPVSLGNGLNAPGVQYQTVQTTVLAADGETIVLGGLITKQENRIQNGIPILEDILTPGAVPLPVASDSAREVLIIMTPQIMRARPIRRILAEETAKMHWCLPDVGRIHGGGMEVMGPAADGARPVPNGQIPMGQNPPGGYYTPGPAYFGSITPPVATGTNPPPAVVPQPGTIHPHAQPYYPGISGPAMPAAPTAPPALTVPTAAPGTLPVPTQPVSSLPPAMPTSRPRADSRTTGRGAPVVPTAAMQPMAPTPPAAAIRWSIRRPRRNRNPAPTNAPADKTDRRNTEAKEGRLT